MKALLEAIISTFEYALAHNKTIHKEDIEEFVNEYHKLKNKYKKRKKRDKRVTIVKQKYDEMQDLILRLNCLIK